MSSTFGAPISIDRMQGPNNGIVILFIQQLQDWESDPFLVRNLRQKIQSYQEYIVSQEFRGQYPGIRAKISLECVFSPPSEIKSLLSKEGINIQTFGVDETPEESSTSRGTSSYSAFGQAESGQAESGQAESGQAQSTQPQQNFDQGPTSTEPFQVEALSKPPAKQDPPQGTVQFGSFQSDQLLSDPAPQEQFLSDPAPQIDKIKGPHQGVIELFITQMASWESDPFLVKNLRDKIKNYKKYIKSSNFKAQYPNCHGQIAVEALFAPPSEIKRLLLKDGVIFKDFDSEQEPSAPSQPTRQPLVENPIQAAQIQAAPIQAAPVQQFKTMSAPPPEEDWEKDLDPDPGMSDSIQRSSKGGLIFTGIVLLFAIGGILFGLLGKPAQNNDPDPKVRPISSISSTSLPKQSYSTISLRPDRRVLVFIPILNSKNNQHVYHVLSAAKGNRRLLIFGTYTQSQLIERLETATSKFEPGVKTTKPIWKSDIIEDKDIRMRTYTGNLKKLQRFEGGVLELMMGDQYQDVNKIPGLVNVKFPMDSMVLLIGQKPSAPKGPHDTIFMFSLILTLLCGPIMFFMMRSGNRNSF